MDYFFILVFVGCLFIGLFLLTRAEKVVKGKDTYPFVKRATLCTQKERKFLGCLVMAVGSKYLIFSKVRMADLVKMSQGINENERIKAYGKVSKDHVDFVLCDKVSTEIICVVDLYDRSQDNKTEKKRALYMDKLFRQVDIPFVRFPILEKYPIRIIRENIQRVIQRSETKGTDQAGWQFVEQKAS